MQGELQGVPGRVRLAGVLPSWREQEQASKRPSVGASTADAPTPAQNSYHIFRNAFAFPLLSCNVTKCCTNSVHTRN